MQTVSCMPRQAFDINLKETSDSLDFDLQRTIYAPATAPGRSAVAIIRLSGPGCDLILGKILGGRLTKPRLATLRAIRHPVTGEALDRGLVLRFPAPASYTGEDMAELHVTGGRAVMSAILASLASFGLRAADPGEFALRAFQNGKIDLSQVEGLAELVDSQTQAQRRHALAMADGALSRWSEAIRELIIDAMSNVEALIDFADEDIELEDSVSRARDLALAAAASVREALHRSRSAERLRQGLNVVIAGAPNAGKSTLMNALAQREVAIVSDYPGTTRDPIEVHLELRGFPVTIIDTAGIRDSTDEVEKRGIEIALKRAATADAVLWLSESSERRQAPKFQDVRTVQIHTKCDVNPYTPMAEELAISAKTGHGMDDLVLTLSKLAEEHFSGSETSIFSLERHRGALRDCVNCLDRVSNIKEGDLSLEMMAEELRLAARALSRIAGRIDVEDVLGSIFSRLCIGK